MAIYLSREKVTVYVGSFGERKDTMHLKLGLLECYLKKNMAWDRGLCVPESKNFTLNGQIWFIALGPVVTVLCVIVFGICAYSAMIPNWIRVFAGLMCFITLIDALRYLIPSKRPILMADDGISYNNGQLLRNLLQQKRLGLKFKEVEIATNQKDPENAYLLANRGLAAFKIGQIAAGLDDLERAKRIDPEESYVYRNLGIALLDQGFPTQANENFIKAQALNPQTHLLDSLLEKAKAA
jgi:tetratricopeptide (TPR) repeat protein